MGSASKRLAPPAVFEVCVGIYLILRSDQFALKHDEGGTGVAVVGVCMLVFAQSMMVFSADPSRVPKGALIAFKGVLCALALYAVIMTSSKRSMPWLLWGLFFVYVISSVPVGFMIYAAALHGKTTESNRLNQLSVSERAALHR